MLSGREAECARLAGLLDAARSGHSSVLVVAGDAGIGKTALLDDAASSAQGFAVLRARGVESESDLPFSALYDLLRPLLSRLEEIPELQGAALKGALALGPPVTGDRFTVCVATLSLLAAAAEERPLLAVVDDAQWVDSSSLEALLFVARRLEAEGVVLLFGLRAGNASAFRRAGLPELPLSGLAGEAALRVLRSTGRVMADEVAHALVEATGGSPLALLEIPAALTEAQLEGLEPLADPLPTGPILEQALVQRIESLPEPTRRALLVAAAAATGDLDTITRACSMLQLADDALEPAERAGIVHLDGERLDFRHPLLRSAVYHSASAIARRSVHRALADVSGGTGAAEERAWHLATAASDPDEDVAKALDETALDSRRRGAYAAAASAWERAAGLSEDGETKARRMLEAADDARLAGRSEHAIELLDTALTHACDPLLRADIQHLRGSIEVWRGAPMAAHRVLAAEAEAVVELDPEKAAAMLADAVFPCFIAGDSNTGLKTAQRAQEAARRAGGSAELFASALVAAATILRGEAEDAHALILSCAPLLDERDYLTRRDQLVHFAGALLVWIEEYEWARLLLTRTVEQARALAAPGVLPYGLASLSALEFRTGHWVAASANAAEALRLASETGQSAALSYALVCLARVEAAQGREGECRSHVQHALEIAGQLELGSVPMFTGSVLGLLELGLGQPEPAIAQLTTVSDLVDQLGLGDPGVVQWTPDLIEALIRVGDRDAAERALADFERRARHTNRTWALATAARCRGLLAADGELEQHFAEALEWHARTPTPFERARTQLCFGERLRRGRRRADARAPLREALDTFERLGAEPWAERARQELLASGETARRREATAIEQLTPQELQVALIVARGATNKEAGSALFLSPKTIETHLGRVYRKLDVRSRTELAHVIAEERVLA